MAQETSNAMSFSESVAPHVEAQHRGFLNANDEVVATCSSDYLLSLGLEILRAKASPMVKVTKYVSHQEQVSRLQFISTETRRLFRHPGLFPSDSARVRFAALLALDSDLQFVEAVKELLLFDLQADLDKYNRGCYTRVDYQPGSKGWENFLLNMAPGAPPLSDEPIHTIPKSAYQLIPAVGMRIVGDANRDEEVLHQWFERHPDPPNVDPAATTKLAMMDLDDPESQGKLPNIGVCQQSESGQFIPNPHREDLKIRLDLPIYGPESLEECSQFVGRLEPDLLVNNMPVPPMTGPNIFPVIALRSWKPPTRLNDLKYVNPSSSTGTE